MNNYMKKNNNSELEKISGVGKSIAKDLESLGIHHISDLVGKNPEVLYEAFCKKKA